MWRALKLAILASALSLAACRDDQRASEVSAPTSASTEEGLIEAAATDFRVHVAPSGADFRNVHVGVMRGDNGVTRSLICGEFRAPDQEWQTFSTIQTEPYEYWLGSVAEAQCTASDTTLDAGRDLSGALTQHYLSPG